MPTFPGARQYRVMMQRIGLDSIKDSPYRRVQRAAQYLAQAEAARNGADRATQPHENKTSAVSSGSTSTSKPRASPVANKSESVVDDSVVTDNWDEAVQYCASSSSELLHGFDSTAALEGSRGSMMAQLRAKAMQAMESALTRSSQSMRHEGRNAESESSASPQRSPESSTGNNTKKSSLNESSPRDTPSDAFTEAGSEEDDRDAVPRHYYNAFSFDERWDGIQRSLSVLGRMSSANTVAPFKDSGDAFEAMWSAVDAGQREVLWQTYICKDDSIGQKTVKKLCEAQGRGCATELLYDCGGNISGRARLTEGLKQSGASVVRYRPFFRSTWNYFMRGMDWRRSPGLRNHRKIVLVDGEVGFCGGLNIGNEYCGKGAGGSGKFRDTHCSVRGPAVAHLREVYDDTKNPQQWKFTWTRWRQIASTQFQRKYALGMHSVEANMLQPLQSQTRSAARKSGVYVRKQLRKAEEGTNRMISKMRWTKQQEGLQKMMHWYSKRVLPLLDEPTDREPQRANHPPRFPGAVTEDAEVELQEQQQSESECSASSPSTLLSGQEAELFSDATTAAAAAAVASDGLSSSSGSGSLEVTSAVRTTILRRKVMMTRIRALYNANDIPHKRSYTRLLREMPIEDTEPVPEAEMYGALRGSMTQIVSCNPRYHDYSIQFAFWQVTRKCHRRIWVTTPYYLPTRKLMVALIHAANRGVDVRLLAGSSKTTDPWFMWYASHYITERLLRAGVRIFEFKGDQIMHAKTVVVDSIWSSIGSYNWDLMSNKNLEVCLCHLDYPTAREMERQFLEDLAESEEVRLEEFCNRSLWQRLVSWGFYHGLYLLKSVTFLSFKDADLED